MYDKIASLCDWSTPENICFVLVCPIVAASKIGVLQLTDAQKHLVEEDAGQTLAQQENMQISGSQARQMVMQKLLRNTEV
jgi:hypothetical protein